MNTDKAGDKCINTKKYIAKYLAMYLNINYSGLTVTPVTQSKPAVIVG